MADTDHANRRIALQIAAQLPDNLVDATAVLALAGDIVRMVHGEPLKPGRVLRLIE